jgi:predicted dehydrogenase
MDGENAAYSRSLAYSSQFEYIRSEDRYFLKQQERRFKIAVLGTGIHGRGHIKTACIEGRAAVAGIYDPHPESVAAAKKLCAEYEGVEPRVYESVQEALGDTEIDGYMIVTPNFTHRELLEQLLNSGRPVFLEKPMATNVADAAAMVNAARRSDVPVQVGLQYRYKSIYVEAIHELLGRHSIGEIKTLGIREHRIPFLDKVHQWNKFSRYSGGTLVEKCCHYFDLFNLFSRSRPARVYATGSQAASYGDFQYHGERSDILDNASVLVDYENGIKANFDLCMFVPLFFEEFVACGDGGRLRAYEQEDYLVDDSLQSGLEVYRGERYPSRKSEPRYQGVVRETGHSGADFYAHKAFVDLLNGATDGVPTIEEGYWSVVVGAAAEESVRRGQPVDIPQFIAEQDASIE